MLKVPIEPTNNFMCQVEVPFQVDAIAEDLSRCQAYSSVGSQKSTNEQYWRIPPCVSKEHLRQWVKQVPYLVASLLRKVGIRFRIQSTDATELETIPFFSKGQMFPQARFEQMLILGLKNAQKQSLFYYQYCTGTNKRPFTDDLMAVPRKSNETVLTDSCEKAGSKLRLLASASSF